MAEDWTSDVQKYAPNADRNAIAEVVRLCGISLQRRDSFLVSLSDKEEVARVREGFLKKKLGLPDPDAEFDKAIMAVGDRMKATGRRTGSPSTTCWPSTSGSCRCSVARAPLRERAELPDVPSLLAAAAPSRRAAVPIQRGDPSCAYRLWC